MRHEELKHFLEEAESEYGVVPFWFINHYPEEAEARRQIRDMAAQHCGGIMLHARDGLRGGYLNFHWERFVSWAIDEARKHGMKVWLYDELNYPSGPAGGLIFEQFPDTSMQSLELAYARSEKPKGRFDKLLHSGGKYLGFRVRCQRQYPDYLDAVAMAGFVRQSYHWYAERFKADFGSVILGEFTDNSCANFGRFRRSIPWTANMEDIFREKTGMELDSILPSLFFRTENSALHRLLFWRFLNQQYLDSFVIPIENECQANGIAATGHYCIEDGSSEHVRQIGDRFDLKRHQHIPGVDMLGARDWETLGKFPLGTASELLPMTSSTSYFLHGSRTLCECFGCSLRWGMNLAEMMRITGTLAALGVDLFVPHGIYYSISGSRKRENVPDFLHNPLWESFAIWARRAARLSALTAHSLHLADTALLYPVISQQASMVLTGNEDQDDIQLTEADEEGASGASFKNCGSRCKRIDSTMRHAARSLLRNGIPFECISEELICSAECADGELRIPLPQGGRHVFHTIVLPNAWLLNEATARKLCSFAECGGHLIALCEPVSAVFTGQDIVSFAPPEGIFAGRFRDFDVNLEENEAAFLALVRKGMRSSRISLKNNERSLAVKEWRRSDGQYFALVHNFTREHLQGVEISCSFKPTILDMDRLEARSGGECLLHHDFDYGETLVIMESDETAEWTAPLHERPTLRFDISPDVWNVRPEGLNAYRLLEQNCQFPTQAFSRFFRSSFAIRDLPGTLLLAMDVEPTDDELREGIIPLAPDGTVHPANRCLVRVNGHLVRSFRHGSHLDRWIYEADILPFVHLGENMVELEQDISLKRVFNTPPDAFILLGNFGVANGELVKCPECLSSPAWSGTALEHYVGAVCFTARVPVPKELRGRACELHLTQVHEIAELTVNEHPCGIRIMPPWKFAIPPELMRNDTLQLSLRIRNTPANLWLDPIPSGVFGPITLCAECP